MKYQKQITISMVQVVKESNLEKLIKELNLQDNIQLKGIYE